jgi:pimeloyl-ACP methyl ester carboxylesterase
MITEKVFFPNNLGQRLAGKIYRGDVPSRRGVIFCHGLFSTKDGYKITSLAGDMVAAGFTLLAFDFSFVGESGGRLEDLSVLQEVRDLECAVEFFLGRGIDELHLMGSSMGGVVSLLYCGGRPAPVKSLILVATPLDLRLLLEKNAGIPGPEDLPAEGSTSIDGISIRNSFFREAMALDVAGAAAAVRAPALIMHGAGDSVVDVADACRLAALLKGDRKLVIVSDGDHHLTRPADIARLRREVLLHLADAGS